MEDVEMNRRRRPRGSWGCRLAAGPCVPGLFRPWPTRRSRGSTVATHARVEWVDFGQLRFCFTAAELPERAWEVHAGLGVTAVAVRPARFAPVAG